MTGWVWAGAAFLCGSAGFLLGCICASAAGHSYCRREAKAQRDYIDYLEGGGDVVAEAEDLLREPGT